MRFYTLTIISSVFALLSAAANAAPTPEEDILLNVEFVLDVSLLLTVGADDDNFAIRMFLQFIPPSPFLQTHFPSSTTSLTPPSPTSLLPSLSQWRLLLTTQTLANANEDATSITQNGGPATCTFYGADGVVAVTTDGQTVPIVPPQPLESGKCTS